MKKIIILLSAIVCYSIAIACYNEKHLDKQGKQTRRSDPLDHYYNEPDKSSAREFLNKYDVNKLEQYDKDIQSDIAVNLSYIGKPVQAVEILKRLQKKYPDDYNIAANLGTTYELTGNNELALQFIKKSIQLNPDSHEGTEWVHVKILEAKLAMNKDPNWLQTHRVLNTGVTFDAKASDILYDKAYDVEYQLQERIPFTPAPDKIMGNVFDELGDLYATQQSIELAYIAYDFSLRYDPADPYGVKKKMDSLKSLLEKNKIPIPSWKQHYYNRELSKLQSDITEKVITTIADGDKLKKTTDAVTDLWDTISGEKARREKEKRRKQNLLLIGGSLVALLSVLGYFRYKKQRAAK
jgi:tetratricopeptide (TPR) repeat protein